MKSALFIGAVLCALACNAAAQDYTTINLDPFTQISVCTPFNVAIQPGPDYAVQIAAEAAVKKVLEASVSGGVLSLQTNGAFTTSQPIQCIISLPAAELASVSVVAPSTEVLLRNGFRLGKLTATVGGQSSLLAASINAAAAALTATGAGTIALAGDLGGLQISNTGTGTIYTSGVSAAAATAVSGSGRTIVLPLRGAAISTTPGGAAGTINIVNGQCTVAGGGAAAAGVCTGLSNPTLPAAQITSTCGLRVSGNFQCSGGAGTYGSVPTPAGPVDVNQQQNINFNNGGVQSSSQATGTESAYASSSSSSTPDGSYGATQTSSDGQGFGLSSSNPTGGSNTGVSGFGGTTSTGHFLVGTCGTSSPVIFAGAGSGAAAVAATPGAQAAATAG